MKHHTPTHKKRCQKIFIELYERIHYCSKYDSKYCRSEFSLPILPEIDNEPLSTQYWCVLHQLNLALKDCNERPWVKTMIANLKLILNHFKNADAKRQILNEYCDATNTVFLQLKVPSDTRFNYWYDIGHKIIRKFLFMKVWKLELKSIVFVQFVLQLLTGLI